MTYRRRNRILCLHGPAQSAASFRAALKPICDRMESNWEFHFLDAPFIIPDDDDTHGERQSNVWSDCAILASRLVAIDAEMQRDGQQPGKLIDVQMLQNERAQTWAALDSTAEGRQTWETQQQSGTDGVESLVSTKVARSMSRGWTASMKDTQPVGVDVGLALIGDYMRENGTFHGILGYDSGSTLALLVQTLLSYPLSSSKTFPSFFAQLPKGMKRMPRMGGWEEEPPAEDDPRLGVENLTRDYVPAQKPFEVVIAFHPEQAALGSRAQDWLAHKQPILHTSSSQSFASHSLGIHHAHRQDAFHVPIERRLVYTPDAYVFDKAWTTFLASFLTLAIESCQGDHNARSKLSQLSIASPFVEAKL